MEDINGQRMKNFDMIPEHRRFNGSAGIFGAGSDTYLGCSLVFDPEFFNRKSSGAGEKSRPQPIPKALHRYEQAARYMKRQFKNGIWAEIIKEGSKRCAELLRGMDGIDIVSATEFGSVPFVRYSELNVKLLSIAGAQAWGWVKFESENVFVSQTGWDFTEPSRRRTLSPGLRLLIMERDGFACQYCGAQADDAKLEIDHIEPWSKSRSDLHTNLVVACFDCNRGKAARSLSNRPKRVQDILDGRIPLPE